MRTLWKTALSLLVWSSSWQLVMERNDLANAATFQTLLNISGHGNRRNDVLFSAPLSANIIGQQDSWLPDRHVVFFPGDVQNFRKAMKSHPASQRWSQWSYENTSALLHRRFPNSYVWIIKPSRIHDATFSCYDNFLPGNIFGAPTDDRNFDGLLHLRKLLSGAIQAASGLQKRFAVPTFSKHCPLILVGFSKGCVVLNQFVHELDSAQQDPALAEFLGTLGALYWLDAGHSLASRVWITDPEILQRLSGLGVAIHVHVTPRQVRDPCRPHIGEEERLFVDLLKQQGAEVHETLHFPDEQRSMGQHFRLLDSF